MTISEAFELYRLDVIIFRNQSPKREEMNRHTCKVLIDFVGDIEVEVLSFSQIRDWKRLLERNRELSTVREYIICLRVVLKHLQKLGRQVVDWELIAVPKRPAKVVDFLTAAQVSQLLAAMSQPVRGYPKIARLRNCAVISLFYASGIRATELRNLNRADLRNDNTFTVVGKGGKARLCFFDSRARDYIENYLAARADTNPALFIADQTGKRLSKSGLQMIFDRARRLVDFHIPVHAHTLRHSYATNLLQNNTNMRYVQEMLGHSSITTTQMYTHVVNQDLRRVYEESHTI
jgi:site-specific recombinase XerD